MASALLEAALQHDWGGTAPSPLPKLVPGRLPQEQAHEVAASVREILRTRPASLEACASCFALAALALDVRARGTAADGDVAGFRKALAPAAIEALTTLVADIVKNGDAATAHAAARQLLGLAAVMADLGQTAALLAALNGLSRLLPRHWRALAGRLDPSLALSRLCIVYVSGSERVASGLAACLAAAAAAAAAAAGGSGGGGKGGLQQPNTSLTKMAALLNRLLQRMATLLYYLGAECRTDVIREVAAALASTTGSLRRLRLGRIRAAEGFSGTAEGFYGAAEGFASVAEGPAAPLLRDLASAHAAAWKLVAGPGPCAAAATAADSAAASGGAAAAASTTCTCFAGAGGGSSGGGSGNGSAEGRCHGPARLFAALDPEGWPPKRKPDSAAATAAAALATEDGQLGALMLLCEALLGQPAAAAGAAAWQNYSVTDSCLEPLERHLACLQACWSERFCRAGAGNVKSESSEAALAVPAEAIELCASALAASTLALAQRDFSAAQARLAAGTLHPHPLCRHAWMCAAARFAASCAPEPLRAVLDGFWGLAAAMPAESDRRGAFLAACAVLLAAAAAAAKHTAWLVAWHRQRLQEHPAVALRLLALVPATANPEGVEAEAGAAALALLRNHRDWQPRAEALAAAAQFLAARAGDGKLAAAAAAAAADALCVPHIVDGLLRLPAAAGKLSTPPAAAAGAATAAPAAAAAAVVAAAVVAAAAAPLPAVLALAASDPAVQAAEPRRKAALAAAVAELLARADAPAAWLAAAAEAAVRAATAAPDEALESAAVAALSQLARLREWPAQLLAFRALERLACFGSARTAAALPGMLPAALLPAFKARVGRRLVKLGDAEARDLTAAELAAAGATEAAALLNASTGFRRTLPCVAGASADKAAPQATLRLEVGQRCSQEVAAVLSGRVVARLEILAGGLAVRLTLEQ